MTTQVPSNHREPPRDVEDGPAEQQPAKKQSHARRYWLGAIVVVLGAIASLMAVAVSNCYENAKINTAKITIKNIEQGLTAYQKAAGDYPSQAAGLNALMTPPGNQAPFLKEVPNDPWGNPFLYFNPAQRTRRTVEVVSKGVDGTLGTDDDLFTKARAVHP